MVILVSFVCLFFPYFLSCVFGVAGLQFAEPMRMVTTWLVLLDFAINGFIYAIVNHDFRRAFKRIIFCHMICRGISANSIAPT